MRSDREGLRVGQVAEAAGVNAETLRYYERRGLLPAPERTLGGHRLYSADAVTVLRVIKAAQRLGFSLDEVGELLAAGRHQHRTRGGRTTGTTSSTGTARLQVRAVEKLAEVEAKIEDLQVIAATLRAAVEAECDDLMKCAANEDCCPIPFATIVTIPVPAPQTRALQTRVSPSPDAARATPQG